MTRSVLCHRYFTTYMWELWFCQCERGRREQITSKIVKDRLHGDHLWYHDRIPKSRIHIFYQNKSIQGLKDRRLGWYESKHDYKRVLRGTFPGILQTWSSQAPMLWQFFAKVPLSDLPHDLAQSEPTKSKMNLFCSDEYREGCRLKGNLRGANLIPLDVLVPTNLFKGLQNATIKNYPLFQVTYFRMQSRGNIGEKR